MKLSGKIAIVTDSTCDIPSSELSEKGIFMVPLSVFFGDEESIDNLDLTPALFYEKLQATTVFPTTSQPPAGKFMILFQELKKMGYEQVLCIHLSKKFSGTAQSALSAAKLVPDLRVEVIDSKSVCLGLGHLVEFAKTSIDSGASFEEVIDAVNKKIPTITILFSVDSLDALKRGGRIGQASALVGKYLGIKPILAMRNGTGEIEVLDKVFSTESAFKRIAREVEKVQSHSKESLRLTLLYAAIKSYRDGLAEALNYLPVEFKAVETGRIGSVVGTHLGPNGWGLIIS